MRRRIRPRARWVLPLAALVTWPGNARPQEPGPTLPGSLTLTARWFERFPFDDLVQGLRFVPGSEWVGGELSFRDARPTILLDGQPVRMLGAPALGLRLPRGAVDSLSLQSTPASISYGDAGGAALDYRTRGGEGRSGFRVRAETDRLLESFGSSFTNLAGDLDVRLPLAGSPQLRVGVEIQGHRYSPVSDRWGESGRFFLASGQDTVIRLARTPGPDGVADSVDVVVPEYEQWAGTHTSPLAQDDRYAAFASLAAPVLGGSATLSAVRTRDQGTARSVANMLNPDAVQGTTDSRSLLQLQYERSLGEASRFSAAGSYQHRSAQEGLLHAGQLQDGLHPALGFRPGALEFEMDRTRWPVTDRLIDAARSGILPDSLGQLAPRRNDLAERQGVPGVASTLRLNPWGTRSGFPIAGGGNVVAGWRTDRQWQGRILVEGRFGGAHRWLAGSEITSASHESLAVPRYQGRSLPNRFAAAEQAVFLEDAFHRGAFSFLAGVRLARYAPDATVPRVPGYSFNVPDSLTRDLQRLRPGDGSVWERMYNDRDCGGDATAAVRRNPTTQELVCKDNFVPVPASTVLNARLGAQWRLNEQTALRLVGSQVEDAAVDAGVYRNGAEDLAGGSAHIGTPFSRGLEPVRRRELQLGLARRLTRALTADVELIRFEHSNALAWRLLPFRDPNTGAPVHVTALTNYEGTVERTLAQVRFLLQGRVAEALFGYVYQGGPDENASDRTHTASALLSIRPAERLHSPLVQGITLQFAGRVASGFRFTRLVNQGNGTLIGEYHPAYLFQQGSLAEEIGASHAPPVKELDLRIDRRIAFRGRSLTVFVDARNPLGFTTTHTLYAETGTTENTALRDRFLFDHMSATTLDGDAAIDDFDILAEAERTNPVNQYMLLATERRFGNGDGIFTTEEQRATFMDLYRTLHGTQHLEHANRLLRIGIELRL